MRRLIRGLGYRFACGGGGFESARRIASRKWSAPSGDRARAYAFSKTKRYSSKSASAGSSDFAVLHQSAKALVNSAGGSFLPILISNALMARAKMNRQFSVKPSL